LLWYLSGREDSESIEYYIRDYGQFAEKDGTVHGAYGPRLFGLRGINQVENVRESLKRDDSRKAVIQLFSAEDIDQKYNDVPCTCAIQFFRRGGKLDMFTSMRSNDAFVGLPHDIFAFTMLQEIFARDAGLALGSYSHAVGSLHLYDANRSKAQVYLDEGWQLPIEMPRMPSGDPWPEIKKLLLLEETLRLRTPGPAGALSPYWSDLGALLRIFALTRGRNHPPTSDLREVARIKNEMVSSVYANYIRKRETRFSQPNDDLLEPLNAHSG